MGRMIPFRRNRHPVQLRDVSADLARRHAARVHQDDLVVETRQAPGVLFHQLRLEAPLAVSRHLQGERAGVGLRLCPLR